MTLGIMPPMRETLRKRRPGEEINFLAENAMVREVCSFHSLSWRALGCDPTLSDEQQTIVRNLEYLWAPDVNSALRNLLTFGWLRDAIAEEARLVAKLFPVKRRRKASKSKRLASNRRSKPRAVKNKRPLPMLALAA
jgi:hypothetical protein